MRTAGFVLSLAGLAVAAAGIFPLRHGLRALASGKPPRRSPNVFLCVVLAFAGFGLFAAGMMLDVSH